MSVFNATAGRLVVGIGFLLYIVRRVLVVPYECFAMLFGIYLLIQGSALMGLMMLMSCILLFVLVLIGKAHLEIRTVNR